MRVVVIPAARSDLADVYAFIAQENRLAATRVRERLFALFEQLAEGDLQGPQVQLADGRRVHRWSAPPYRVYYRRSARGLAIIRVYHQSRRPIEQGTC